MKAGRWDGLYPLDYYDYESTCGAKNADIELCCFFRIFFGLVWIWSARATKAGGHARHHGLGSRLEESVYHVSTRCPISCLQPFPCSEVTEKFTADVDSVFLQRILCSLLLCMVLM